MTSGLMLIPEAHRGFGIASERLAGPWAQVPLLRSSQRDPSIQDIVRATRGAGGELTPSRGRETLQVAGIIINTSGDLQGLSIHSHRHKHSKGRGGWRPMPPH